MPNVNVQLVRKKVYETYLMECPGTKDAMKRFTGRLKAFAKWAPWIFALNPQDVLNTQGRNIRSSRDLKTGELVQEEMIHLRTVDEERRSKQIMQDIWGPSSK